MTLGPASGSVEEFLSEALNVACPSANEGMESARIPASATIDARFRSMVIRFEPISPQGTMLLSNWYKVCNVCTDRARFWMPLLAWRAPRTLFNLICNALDHPKAGWVAADILRQGRLFPLTVRSNMLWSFSRLPLEMPSWAFLFCLPSSCI